MVETMLGLTRQIWKTFYHWHFCLEQVVPNSNNPDEVYINVM
jgi:hypothetical protein